MIRRTKKGDVIPSPKNKSNQIAKGYVGLPIKVRISNKKKILEHNESRDPPH